MNTSNRRLLVGLTALMLSLTTASGVTAAPAAKISVAVTTVMPKQLRFPITVRGYGSIQAAPSAAVTLSEPQPVRVAAVEVVPGQRVHPDQTLLRLQTEPAGRLAYQRARTQEKLARQDLQHTRALFQRQLATRSQLDLAEKNLADAESALATQRALGGDRTDYPLKAPTAAVVQSVAARRGARVVAGGALVQLASAAGQQARIGVEPGQVKSLRPGMAVKLTPAFGGSSFSGRVMQVGHRVDPTTRLVDVWVGFNETAQLPLGSELSAKLKLKRLKAWAVPRGAVLSDQRGSYLFQVRNGVAHRVEVKLVQPAGGIVGVEGPLDPKRPVVVLGSYELHDGMHVRMSTR